MFKDLVFLTNTDTAIGFVSQNSDRLDDIKRRDSDKRYIRAVNSLSTLKDFSRVPKRFRNMVRRSKRSTFIIGGESFRVVDDDKHLLLLNRMKWAYTTSANLSGCEYDEGFARGGADVIILPLRKNKNSSSIYKIGKGKIQKIR